MRARRSLLLALAVLPACSLSDGPSISGISPTDDTGALIGAPDPDDWRVSGSPVGRVSVFAASPNPTAASASVGLELGTAQAVRVRLLDRREEEVLMLHDGRLDASVYRFDIRPPDGARGLYRVELVGEGWRAHGDVRFH